MLARFSKALAEAPEGEKNMLKKCQAFSWYADADSSCPVKIGKDGSGFLKLWQQQIQQFNNVGPEVAEAITSEYPSPQSLIKAYKECSSLKKAETLLQDIVVRRNYGPLGTQRRIGPELSYKIYLFYTSKDGDQILQR
ncbi:crossover junction endonuclease EME1 [Caerostris extrusa]|uniref:Crossover junction endonuclease EME1 n=1 Tax=Caerostris extrusa TaxID=172846 RepID=A0AAV4QQC2_CAEEX|nr:crossover junction endonuclease EME1 [Caerostris extrusa]